MHKIAADAQCGVVVAVIVVVVYVHARCGVVVIAVVAVVVCARVGGNASA